MRALIILFHLSLALIAALPRVIAAALRAGRGRRLSAVRSVLGARLARVCERLGPTFVKTGQLLSTRPDLVSREVAGELATLQRDLAPFDTALIPAILEGELGCPPEELFAELEPTPVSSASIANVHRAVLHDGRRVAVKIRRPGIARVMARDFDLLERFARWALELPRLRVLPLAETIAEMRRIIEDQLDLRLEAANSRRFRATFAGTPGVRFPELVEELCGARVLTMEYLEDLVPFDGALKDAPGSRVALERGLLVLYRMIFEEGFVHADLHPGNLCFRSSGGEPEAVFLDFGLVARLNEDERIDFARFFLSIVNSWGQLAAEVIERTAIRVPDGFRREAFYDEMASLVKRHGGRITEEFEVAGFVADLFEVQRRFELTGGVAFVTTVVALLMFEGIAKQVDPQLDFQGLAARFLVHVLVVAP